jgi:hypothetical protein
LASRLAELVALVLTGKIFLVERSLAVLAGPDRFELSLGRALDSSPWSLALDDRAAAARRRRRG